MPGGAARPLRRALARVLAMVHRADLKAPSHPLASFCAGHAYSMHRRGPMTDGALPLMSDQRFDRDALIQWRLDADLSREQLCARAGVSYPYLTAIENGHRTPSLAILVRLAAAYGRDLRELFTEPDPVGAR